MLNKPRQQVTIPFSELTEVDSFFKRHTNIDLTNIPAKYGKDVLETRDLMIESLTIEALYQFFEIQDLTDASVTISSDIIFSGKMPPKILKEASHCFCFVASLKGYDQQIETLDGTMKKYFYDIWGTSFIENASTWLKRKIGQELNDYNLFYSPFWNPGQHQFELVNQRPIFELLSPSDIGLELTSHLKMIPIKSVSGIMGVFNTDNFTPLIPCDFCKLGKSCPASKSGCANS
ncbi:hypothetical protein Q5O14_06380 [Eubacteriaceae bacterium ES2]|nr:hypothetical protein Q5O14_06380 [Eubacteriaceae bacterium ES2]